MTYENNKTIILAILVITSIVLTWNLWTYKPDYETMDKSNTVQDVTLSARKDVGKIIKPQQIIYHFNFAHFGTTNNNEIEEIVQEMNSWKFYALEDITSEVRNIPEFVHVKGNVEIIFPDLIPISLYRKVVNIEDKKVPQFSFNRIVIDVDNKTKEDGTVYFVQYGDERSQRVIASHIKPTAIKKFYSNFYSVSNKMNRYFAYQLTDARTIFLPENRTNLTSFKYFLEQLDPEKFKEALFDDPSVVQKNVMYNNVEYTDATRMMDVNTDTMILAYINPVVGRNPGEQQKDLLQKTIDFVNEHGGWTGYFRYEAIDEINQKVTFRLYDSNGLPIFNDSGLTEIVSIWGSHGKIYKYIRPILALNVPIRSETTDITLISGREAMEHIKAKKGFRSDLLEDLVIGYWMKRDSNEPQIVNLVPSWFYRYNGVWKRITDEELGGVTNGLE